MTQTNNRFVFGTSNDFVVIQFYTKNSVVVNLKTTKRFLRIKIPKTTRAANPPITSRFGFFLGGSSTSDFSALGVLDVATAMHFKVPQKLGIMGYANEPFTELTSPSITTIDQYSMYMGKTIADLYFQEIDNKEVAITPKTISIKPKLIVRLSTSKKG